jgi:hypothetical protein
MGTAATEPSDDVAFRVFGNEDLRRSIQFEPKLGDERGATPA